MFYKKEKIKNQFKIENVIKNHLFWKMKRTGKLKF